MPRRSVQSKYPRYRIQLPLLHRVIGPSSTGAGMGWTRNLSEGGACLEVTGAFRPETPLRLRLQTERGAIEADAEVVWAGVPDPASGVGPHGVAFTQVAADQLQALREVLYSRKEARHAGLRVPLDLAVTCQLLGSKSGLCLEGRTADVSRGGLMIRLPKILPVETRLRITLHGPAEQLTMEGRIVWVKPPERRRSSELIGHGVRFTSLDDSLSHSLGSLLAEPL
ncbi:MAG TPA: PilZ domain-containing protein [Candidatus Methylomirabilis sp.]|nr:PilZ domain-containing protein [Candidatus Methylomirabilis sp.]